MRGWYDASASRVCRGDVDEISVSAVDLCSR